jgi:hypothetical protein
MMKHIPGRDHPLVGRWRRCPHRVYRMHHEVTDIDTAVALGSGDVPVLATPRLISSRPCQPPTPVTERTMSRVADTL